MSRGPHFKQREMEIISASAAAGKTAGDATAALNAAGFLRSRSNVAQFAKRLGIIFGSAPTETPAPPPTPPEPPAQVVTASHDGSADRPEAARETGRTPNGSDVFREEEIRIIREVISSGRSAGDAVSALSAAGWSRTRSSVLGWARRHDLRFRGGRPSSKRPEKPASVSAPKPKPHAPTQVAKTPPKEPRREEKRPPTERAPVQTVRGIAAIAPRRRSKPWPKADETILITCHEVDQSAELTMLQCRFPVRGDARAGTLVWCAAPTWGGTSWCGHHYTRVFVRPN